MPAWRLSGKQLFALIIALIVIYAIYGILVPSVLPITSTRSLSLALNQTQFIKVYNSTTAAIKLKSTSDTGATFYITSVPVLYGPVVSFSLAPASALNVSTDGSQLANMNVRLLSSSSASATVEITPLASALGISPSSSITLLNPASLTNIGASNVTLAISTVSTSSSISTTTIAQNSTQALIQQALTLFNNTGTGALMKEYKALYNQDVACSAGVYNTTYYTYYSKQPPPPVSFTNVSSFTPTDITLNATALSVKNNVLLTYSTVSPSPDTTGPVILAIVNTSSASFIRNLTYTGLFSGFNYSMLNNSYTFQSKILNNCGAYISPP